MMDQKRRALGEARAREYPHEAEAIEKLLAACDGGEAREIAQAELWLARASYQWATASTPGDADRMFRVMAFCEQQLAALHGGPWPNVTDATLDDFMRRVF